MTKFSLTQLIYHYIPTLYNRTKYCHRQHKGPLFLYNFNAIRRALNRNCQGCGDLSSSRLGLQTDLFRYNTTTTAK